MFNKALLTTSFLLAVFCLRAQVPVSIFKDGTAAKRQAFKAKLTKSIETTLLLPINESNEQQFLNFFYNCNLLNYRNEKVKIKFTQAANTITKQTDEFAISFLDAANNLFPATFNMQIEQLFYTTKSTKVTAMACHYLLPVATEKQKLNFKKHIDKLPLTDIVVELRKHFEQCLKPLPYKSIEPFFAADYLPNQALIVSVQRKNRNYPGIALVRKANGEWVKNDSGKYFSVEQLARSLSNMPGFISNGNTPQGIFKFTGFDTSTNYFIGTTTNLQLVMPNEYYRDSINGAIVDTSFTFEQYKNLLPQQFKNYEPMYNSFYAGKIGRTEIIAHGTTVDVDYYKGQSYYPFTPTMGCLATIEIWNNRSGALQVSDQFKLAQAVKQTGKTNGYLIVIEIDDKKTAVSLADIMGYLK
jgi:hypothetical protein